MVEQIGRNSEQQWQVEEARKQIDLRFGWGNRVTLTRQIEQRGALGRSELQHLGKARQCSGRGRNISSLFQPRYPGNANARSFGQFLSS